MISGRGRARALHRGSWRLEGGGEVHGHEHRASRAPAQRLDVARVHEAAEGVEGPVRA